MASIKIDTFKGIRPRAHPTLLEEGMATEAHNLVLNEGKIVPLRESSVDSTLKVFLENGLASIDSAKTIYPWKRRVDGNLVTTILAWPGVVTVARSNLADDERDRLFVTGETGYDGNKPLVYTNNRDNRTIGRMCILKDKLPAPSVSIGTSGRADEDNLRYTYFYQTWVDMLGYESPPSDASVELTYNDGDPVHIDACTKPTYAVARRIYKTITGSSTESDANNFVAEFSGATAFMAHDIIVKDEDAGEVMPVIENPPEDIEGAIYMPGGYYVGFSQSNPHTVMFSEIGLPYSWPEAYQYDIYDNIVGIATAKNTAFVMTDNYVWILRGTAPESMVSAMLSPAACVSKRSICLFNNNVFFASPFGLCMVHNTADEGDVVTNVTDKFMTKDQWAALDPTTCRITAINGQMMASFDGGKNYIFDMTEMESGCLITTHDENAKCGCLDAATDTYYFVKE